MREIRRKKIGLGVLLAAGAMAGLLSPAIAAEANCSPPFVAIGPYGLPNGPNPLGFACDWAETCPVNPSANVVCLFAASASIRGAGLVSITVQHGPFSASCSGIGECATGQIFWYEGEGVTSGVGCTNGTANAVINPDVSCLGNIIRISAA